MYNIIYSADYRFQIICILKCSYDIAWEKANRMAEDGTLEGMGVDHYDVLSFKSEEEGNEYIKEQVRDSRKPFINLYHFENGKTVFHSADSFDKFVLLLFIENEENSNEINTPRSTEDCKRYINEYCDNWDFKPF